MFLDQVSVGLPGSPEQGNLQKCSQGALFVEVAKTVFLANRAFVQGAAELLKEVGKGSSTTFSSFLVTFWSLFLTLLSLFCDFFARLLLPDSFCGRVIYPLLRRGCFDKNGDEMTKMACVTWAKARFTKGMAIVP